MLKARLSSEPNRRTYPHSRRVQASPESSGGQGPPWTRMLFRSLAIIFLVVLCTSLTLAGDFKIVWKHDGFCDDGLPGCPVDVFRIYMSDDRDALAAGKGELVGTVPGDAELEFKYSLPNDGKTRYFAITAVNSRGMESEFSNIIAVVSTQMELEGLLKKEPEQKQDYPVRDR